MTKLLRVKWRQMTRSLIPPRLKLINYRFPSIRTHPTAPKNHPGATADPMWSHVGAKFCYLCGTQLRKLSRLHSHEQKRKLRTSEAGCGESRTSRFN
ncbi:MAG: hypothetical protein KME46_34715 [Brasilonema angustatum HA4187-MV1]|nr:hypothetical protein [Brasilonema angustatum HA4187-MV1]